MPGRKASASALLSDVVKVLFYKSVNGASWMVENTWDSWGDGAYYLVRNDTCVLNPPHGAKSTTI